MVLIKDKEIKLRLFIENKNYFNVKEPVAKIA